MTPSGIRPRQAQGYRARMSHRPVTGHHSNDIVFGVFMPQGWKMELSSIDGASAKWNKAVEIAYRSGEDIGPWSDVPVTRIR